MNDPLLTCQDDRRLARLHGQTEINGLDYVEPNVDTHGAFLYIAFHRGKGVDHITKDAFSVSGGRRETKIAVEESFPLDQNVDRQFSSRGFHRKLKLDRPGDNESEYRLAIVDPVRHGIDPRFSTVAFRFRPGGTLSAPCQAPPIPPPRIDYLSRDYGRLRRMLLDRLSVTLPEWQERHIPDVGIMLVELFAYLGDHLSYRQDAVATEAYLGTARRRISVRRHARLVDYLLHEGCNSRAFVQIQSPAGDELDPKDIFFVAGLPPGRERASTTISLQQIDELGSAVGPLVYFEVCREPEECWRLTPDDLIEPERLISEARLAAVAVADRLVRSAADGLLRTDPSDRLRWTVAEGIPPVAVVAAAAELIQAVASSAKAVSDVAIEPEERILAELFSRLYFDPDWDQSVDSSSNRKDRFGQDAINCILKHLNTRLAEAPLLPLKDSLPRGVSAGTARRLAIQASNRCPGASNRALLEDLFPEWIARRVTRHDLLRTHVDLNEISFYTWDGSQCWLPVGATTATLQDEYLRPPANENETPPRKLRRLAVGQFLLLEEIRGPRTGRPGDANSAHRQIVRITGLRRAEDPLVESPESWNVAGKLRQPLVEVTWHQEDALTFPLCLSASGRGALDGRLVETVSVARGNIVLVDQGLTISQEKLPCMGRSRADAGTSCATAECDGSCHDSGHDVDGASPDSTLPPAPPYRPVLERNDLTHSQPLASYVDPLSEGRKPVSASRIRKQLPHKAEPHVTLLGLPPGPDRADRGMDCGDISRPDNLQSLLRRSPLELCRALGHVLPAQRCQEIGRLAASRGTSSPQGERMIVERLLNDVQEALTWKPRMDVIDAGPFARDFVVEIDDERRPCLRFIEQGPGGPVDGTRFWATYRVGNGSVGNVGAGGITHIGYRTTPLGGRGLTVRNPLPAEGGKDPESIASARLIAPHITRKLKRAIVEDDYQKVVLDQFADEIQSVRAKITPGAVRHVVDVSIDPLARITDHDGLVKRVERMLNRFRRIGHEVRVRPPKYVPIQLTLRIRVQPGHLFEHVQAELRQVFSDGFRSDGSPAFFHPDLRTFGDGIFLSEIVRTARDVVGVRGVEVIELKRVAPQTGSQDSSSAAIARGDDSATNPEPSPESQVNLDRGGLMLDSLEIASLASGQPEILNFLNQRKTP